MARSELSSHRQVSPEKNRKLQLSVREVLGYTKRYPNQKAYSLNVSEKYFGHFHVDDKGSALVWNSNLDFSQLEKTAIQKVSSRLLKGRELPMPENRKIACSIKASFIIEKDGSEELNKYDLKNPEEYAKYNEALKCPDDILFARYDIKDTYTTPEFSYSFTAENGGRLNADQKPELSIRIPKSQEWTEEAVEWAAGTSSEFVPLAGTINSKAATALLSGLVKVL